MVMGVLLCGVIKFVSYYFCDWCFYLVWIIYISLDLIYCSVCFIILLIVNVVELSINVFLVGCNGVIVWFLLWLFFFWILFKRVLNLILSFFSCNCLKCLWVFFFVFVLRKIFVFVVGKIIVFILWLFVINLILLVNVCWWCSSVLCIWGNVVIFDVVILVFFLCSLWDIFLFLRMIFIKLFFVMNCILRCVVRGIKVFFDLRLMLWWRVVKVNMW